MKSASAANYVKELVETALPRQRRRSRLGEHDRRSDDRRVEPTAHPFCQRHELRRRHERCVVRVAPERELDQQVDQPPVLGESQITASLNPLDYLNNPTISVTIFEAIAQIIWVYLC